MSTKLAGPLVVLATLFAAQPAHGAPAAAATAPASAKERELERADDARREAVLAAARGDLRPLEETFAESFTLIGAEGEALDRQAMAESIRADTFHVATWDVLERRVEVVGSTGIVTARVAVSATLRGKDVSGEYWVRHVYGRAKGRWVDVSGQWTRIVSAESAAATTGDR